MARKILVNASNRENKPNKKVIKNVSKTWMPNTTATAQQLTVCLERAAAKSDNHCQLSQILPALPKTHRML